MGHDAMTDVPRLPPLGDDEIAPELREVIERWPYNLHRTLAHSPSTLLRWLPYAEHILSENALPEREREVAILRVAWNARSRYEWGLHGRLARRLGFTDADLAAVVEGPDASHWSEAEAALVRGADEIMRGWKLSDATWEVLARHFDDRQLIDYIFVCCQFLLVAVTLESLRIPLEEGIEPLPEG